MTRLRKSAAHRLNAENAKGYAKFSQSTCCLFPFLLLPPYSLLLPSVPSTACCLLPIPLPPPASLLLTPALSYRLLPAACCLFPFLLLPFLPSTACCLNSDKLNVLLVHGSPRKINEYLFEDRDEKSLLRIMEQADADIMCFGHTHKPYHKMLSSDGMEYAHYRHAINIGSVGKPKDGNNKGCYVLLTINDDGSISRKDAIGVEFIRFDYDIETAAKAVEDSPLPNEYADMLRKGV